jgi:hypothetical protein
MPVYGLTVEIADAANRKTRKNYISQTLADWAAAQAAQAALITDLMAICEGDVLSSTLSLRTVETDTVVSGANVDEGATFVVRKADNYNASHKVPMPDASIRNTDGTINIADSLVIDYFANFLSAGDWTVSDEEVVTVVLGGTLDR